MDTLNGKFFAKIGDLTVEDETLKGIQVKIEDAQRKAVKKDSSLPLIALQSDRDIFLDSGKETKVISIIFKGIHRTSREFQTVPAAGHKNEFRHFAADTPENRAIFETYVASTLAYYKAIRRMEKVEIKIKGYGRISPEEYPGLITKVEKSYQKSLSVGKAISGKRSKPRP